ncbi:Enoyl-CoA hydratase/carnithine racemase [Desulfatibacillum alkenivorans DSM 16219]|uniref:Enoyl-CoA hydratase/carnithine racemase n=1 Tax=Desulfatibacillum alkenivorans DSM 16219 TaxID=1121393 RepID=A0A1M6DXR8_9BACT|nr:enoyl-CoA hydratase-related protein [Desulfatibacillum alkenivorans]SHI77808.1 Enoyl-CoA hydratase/carnithine racemase [Desulfatibacillum alkenivorans DSM 16219]
MSDTVLQDFNDGVLTLTLNRPAKKNAFNTEQWLALADAFDQARENEDVGVVVMTGAGNDFSSGQDLGELAAGRPEGESPYRTLERSMMAFDKPLIGAAKGIAVGGGATTLFFSDVLYVGESLRMRLPFVSLGMAPEFASSFLLQQNIGAQRAAELMLTAEWIDADKALEFGIARAKFSDDELLAKAQEKAAEMAQWPVNGLRETKKCLMVWRQAHIQATLEQEHEAMTKQAGSPENVEAIMAFIEKRKPNFKNLKKNK